MASIQRATGQWLRLHRNGRRGRGTGARATLVRSAALSFLLVALVGPLAPARGSGLPGDRIDVSINGMVCSFCVQGIERKIRSLPATQSVRIDVAKHLVQIRLRPGETITDDQLRRLIRDAGFDVREIKHLKAVP